MLIGLLRYLANRGVGPGGALTPGEFLGRVGENGDEVGRIAGVGFSCDKTDKD